MAIKLPDLRYIRRSPGEIAVLRELVSFQRCKTINPSEFWLAQMTRMSERSVRRGLVKLAKSGLISYNKRKQDFRGPNRPTNTYTLHPERIQELIDAGRKAVDKAMGDYYEKSGTPRHDRKRPARLTGLFQEQPANLAGYTTGQIGPQDVSLSKEQDYVEDSPDSFGEPDATSDEVADCDWEGLRELENQDSSKYFTSCMESSSEVSEPSEFSDTNDPTHPHPPSSAAPPSPSLPPQDDGPPLMPSGAAADESIGSDEPRQVADLMAVKPPFDVESEEWRLMGTEKNWWKLSEFYRFPLQPCNQMDPS